MTLPVSPNQIRAVDIKQELGLLGTTTLNIGSTAARALAGKTTVNSEIKWSDFWGKTAGIVISVPRVKDLLHLYTTAVNAGWDPTSTKPLTIILDCVVWNSVYQNSALEISGYYRGGLTVYIKRGVFGRGGDANYFTPPNTWGSPHNAGHAIGISIAAGPYATPYVKIIADGPIYGGGGSGGGYYSAGGGAGGGHGGDGRPAPGATPTSPSSQIQGGARGTISSSVPNTGPVASYPSWSVVVTNGGNGAIHTTDRVESSGGGGGGFGYSPGYNDAGGSQGVLNPAIRFNDPLSAGLGGAAGGGGGSKNWICGGRGGDGGSNGLPGSPANSYDPACTYASWYSVGGGGGGFGAPGGVGWGSTNVAGIGGKAISSSVPVYTTLTIVDNGPTQIGQPWIRGAIS